MQRVRVIVPALRNVRFGNGGVLTLHRVLVICHCAGTVRKVVVPIGAATAVDEERAVDGDDLHKLLEVVDGGRDQRLHILDRVRLQDVGVDEERVVEWADTDRFVCGMLLQQIPFVLVCIAIDRLSTRQRVV